MAQKSSDVYDYYFENYLILYNLYGRGRPKVDREHYEELDAELMEIISRGDHHELVRADVISVRDIRNKPQNSIFLHQLAFHLAIVSVR